jgi:hypothetical protein
MHEWHLAVPKDVLMDMTKTSCPSVELPSISGSDPEIYFKFAATEAHKAAGARRACNKTNH